MLLLADVDEYNFMRWTMESEKVDQRKVRNRPTGATAFHWHPYHILAKLPCTDASNVASVHVAMPLSDCLNQCYGKFVVLLCPK